jgi:hypothetical protein
MKMKYRWRLIDLLVAALCLVAVLVEANGAEPTAPGGAPQAARP